MKKLLLISFAVTLLVLLCGCADNSSAIDDTTAPDTTENSDSVDLPGDTETTPETFVKSLGYKELVWHHELSEEYVVYMCADNDGKHRLISVDPKGTVYTVWDNNHSVDKIAQSRHIPYMSKKKGEDGAVLNYSLYLLDRERLSCYEVRFSVNKNVGRLSGSPDWSVVGHRAMKELGFFADEGYKEITVTSLEELEKYAHVIGTYKFYYDLLSGESEYEDMNSIKVSDYEIRFTVPLSDETSYITLTVEESGVETLLPGRYEWKITPSVLTDGMIWDRDIYIDPVPDTPETEKLKLFIYASNTYSTPVYGEGIEYPGMHNYICRRYGENGNISYEDFCRIATQEFGVTDFDALTVNLSPDGKTVDEGALGHYGDAYVIKSVTVNNGMTTVDVQFYTDGNYFIRSHLIAYKFTSDGRWMGYEILERSQYEPWNLSLMEEEKDLVLSEDYSINPYGSYCFFTGESSLSDLAYSVYKEGISYEEFWSKADVKKYIAKTLSVMAGTEVSPGSFDAYLIDPGAMYPATIVIPMCDEYNLVIPFAINQDANFVYDAPHKLYGKYEEGVLIRVDCSTGHKAVNGNEIKRTISQSKGVDFDKVTYRTLSMSEAEKKITVPLISDNDIHVAVLKIENDLTYSLESYKKIYPETLSAHDFFITYRSFGFKPTDLIGNDYGIPLSPESEILRVFGTLEVLETMYVPSEFPDYPYAEGWLVIRTQAKFADDPPGISVHFRLKNKLTGEYITKEDVESDIAIYDLEWALYEVKSSK